MSPMNRRTRKSITRQRLSPLQAAKALGLMLKLVWGVMEPILRKAANRVVVEEGLPLARKIVANLSDAALSGTEKREAAVTELKQALVDSKKIMETDIASSMLNWVIETAVNELKSKLTK